MTKTFTGAVMLPGEAGNGLEATLCLDPERVTLTAGDSQLGSWDRADYLITPESNGSFGLTLGGETLVFRPDSPSEFSSTSAVPMAEPLDIKAERKAKSRPSPSPSPNHPQQMPRTTTSMPRSRTSVRSVTRMMTADFPRGSSRS